MAGEFDTNLVEHRHLDKLQEIEVVKYISGNYQVEYRDDILVVDSSAATVTVTLPKARGGKVFQILKQSAANTVVIVPSVGDTILGQSSFVLSEKNQTRRMKAVKNGYLPL